MQKNHNFENMFKADLKALQMGLKLRRLIHAFFLDIEETIVGGAKVQLALYSRGEKNNVLCGIQCTKNGACILYVHHVRNFVHDRLKLTGKGKHAKQIRFSDPAEIKDEDIKWLLGLIQDHAPF